MSQRPAHGALFYLGWILGGLAPIRGLYVLAIASGVVHTATLLVVPLVLREAVLAAQGRPGASLGLVAVLLVVLALAQTVARYEVIYLPHVVAFRYLQLVRIRLFDHLQRLHHGYFGGEQTGDLMSKLLADIDALEHFIAHAFPTSVKLVVVAGATAIVLALIDWRMAIATLALLPVSLVTMLVVSRFALDRYRVLRRRLGEFNALLADSIVGLPVLKSFNREREQLGKVRAKAAQVQEGIASQLQVRDLPLTVTETVSGLATVIVLLVGAARVRAGDLQLADLVVFVLYTLTFYRPFLEMMMTFDRLQDSVTGAERVHALLETKPDIVDAPGAAVPAAPRWDVELRDVTFAYVPGTPVLRGVNFAVGEGRVAALVGPSGAGKSTVAALVARFYDVQAGQVLVGGRDVRELPVSYLRRNVAMVLQDVFLFRDTIRENIRFGRLDATDGEIEAAARAANIHDFIVSLPQGYDTEVGERGARLSGGEKQRLSIARALLKDAPILILDEATSSVDVENEYLIQGAIAQLARGRTVIVIAHRLFTIRGADEIIVLGDGRVVERGRHDALIAQRGAYAAAYAAQERTTEWQIGGAVPAAGPAR
jgi:ATP-binding cassette subfamily B protein